MAKLLKQLKEIKNLKDVVIFIAACVVCLGCTSSGGGTLSDLQFEWLPKGTVQRPTAPDPFVPAEPDVIIRPHIEQVESLPTETTVRKP